MEPAEDHDLWVRAYRCGKLYNVPEVLLYYRLHDNQTSIKLKQKQEANSQKAKKLHLGHLYESLHPQIDILQEPVMKGLDFKKQRKYFKDYIRELDKVN